MGRGGRLHEGKKKLKARTNCPESDPRGRGWAQVEGSGVRGSEIGH